jgi:purine-cytosine permease-like protein
MKIKVDPTVLKEIRWYQIVARFCIGGLITAATGIIAKRFGPAVGGLFLAFPAIFPASATLIEKHECEEKEEAGMEGTKQARQAVSVDAAGAAIGSIGLLFFALFVTEFVGKFNSWLVMLGATLTWAVISVSLWLLRKEA